MMEPLAEVCALCLLSDIDITELSDCLPDNSTLAVPASEILLICFSVSAKSVAVGLS